LLYRKFFGEKFEQLKQGLFKEEQDLFPEHRVTLDAFIHAVGVVRSQIHPPLEGKNAALVPVLSCVHVFLVYSDETCEICRLVTAEMAT